MKSRKKAPIGTSNSAADSSTNQDPRPTGPTEEQVRLRAYELYVERGRADGRDLEDWFQTEREIIEIIRKRQPA